MLQCSSVLCLYVCLYIYICTLVSFRKCPFGGAGDAAKEEAKPSGETEDEKPAEMEIESEESDVELDMEGKLQLKHIYMI